MALLLTVLVGFYVYNTFTALADWAVTPWSGARDHRLASWKAWHGRIMVLSWGVLVPVGILGARYFKVWPGQDWPRIVDDQRWWNAHRILQSVAMGLAAVAAILAWSHSGDPQGLALWHGWAGWGLLILGWGQILGGLLRGSKGGPTDPRAKPPDFVGDHYSMTRKRIVFEYTHKIIGFCALLLSIAVIAMGLKLADAPRWMGLIIGLWWAMLALAAFVLQRSGFCIDTYQAIWGNASHLPGLSRKPIGIGVNRRPAPEDEKTVDAE